MSELMADQLIVKKLIKWLYDGVSLWLIDGGLSKWETEWLSVGVIDWKLDLLI